MLKNIPPIISPEIMLALMQMGHGDEIVLADGNFPGHALARRIVRSDGLSVLPLLEAVLELLPLDPFVEDVAVVMRPVEFDAPEPSIWTGFRHLLQESEGRKMILTQLDRHAFYERARQAYVIVATSEPALYGNLILKKGVIAH